MPDCTGCRYLMVSFPLAKDYSYNSDIYIYFLTFLNRVVPNEKRKKIKIFYYFTCVYSDRNAVNAVWRKGAVAPL